MVKYKKSGIRYPGDEVAAVYHRGHLNPGLYAMAMAAAAMSEKRAEQSGIESIGKEELENISNGTAQGVSWSDFEWKSYEKQMTVSMEKTPVIEGVGEGKFSLS